MLPEKGKKLVNGWFAFLLLEHGRQRDEIRQGVLVPDAAIAPEFHRASGPVSASADPGNGGGGVGTAIVTSTKTAPKKPSMYRVLLLNDDYTPMEFVITVLRRYFNKNADEAARIMLHVHRNGVGECGVFTYEVAETKVTQVMDYARKHQHPLQCIMEKK